MISTVITEATTSWRESWLQEEEVTSERKLRETERNIEGHCEWIRKATAYDPKGTKGRLERLLRSFSVKRTKRISGGASAREEQRMVKEGERGKGDDGRGGKGREEEEEKGKKTVRWLPRVPARLPRRGTYGGLAVLGFTSFLYSWTCENERAQAWHGHIVWSLTSYYYTPYTAVRHTSRQ